MLNPRRSETVRSGALWLHAVYDGIAYAGRYVESDDPQQPDDYAPVSGVQGGFVYSVETKSDDSTTTIVWTTRFDPDNPVPDLYDWQVVVEQEDMEKASYTDYEPTPSPQNYESGADHWHIYAYGKHWIATSLIDLYGEASGCLLTSFVLTSGNQVARHLSLRAWPRSNDGPYDGTTLPILTNDLFLVADPTATDDAGSDIGETFEGLAIGLFRPAVSPYLSGSLILRADRKAKGSGSGSSSDPVRAQVELNSMVAGVPEHTNTASVRLASDDSTVTGEAFRVIAPETTSPKYDDVEGDKGDIIYLEADSAWGLVASDLFVDHTDFQTGGTDPLGTNTHCTMATHVPLELGYWAVAYKVNVLPISGDPTKEDDDGTIVLEIRRGWRHGTRTQREEFLDGNRPHLLYAEGWLILTYDAYNSSVGVREAYVKTYKFEPIHHTGS